tara:strand:+ start:450 stop:1991 length:1542 start_codon:yes stop_codon:yes gene_type:complete
MSSTYTTANGIELINTGEQSGVWGDTTNTNLQIVDRVLTGIGSITLSGTAHTLTTTYGTLSEGMYRVLVLGGSPSGTNTITVAPHDAQKTYMVYNNSGQSAIFTQGTGANVTVANGDAKLIYMDGAGAGASVFDFTANLAMSSVNITGGVVAGSTITGNVDGRDVAADGTKLDGIEALADVTDATNVSAAGALMDSEVTNLAQVKAFDATDYATAAQGSKADSALQDADIGSSVQGYATVLANTTASYLTADETKLDGIEALADVTDTTNVTSAGALMDSEVTNLAQVKAFDATDYATAAQGALADTALQSVASLTQVQVEDDTDTTFGLVSGQRLSQAATAFSGVISKTVISTSVATVDLTGFDATKYTSYEIEFMNVVPVTDNVQLHLRTSGNGGSSFDSGASDYQWAYGGRRSNTTEMYGGGLAPYGLIAPEVGSAAGEDGVSGTIRISGPDLAKRTLLNYKMANFNSSQYLDQFSGAIMRDAAASVNAVQLFFSAGNIESGTIVFRGIR